MYLTIPDPYENLTYEELKKSRWSQPVYHAILLLTEDEYSKLNTNSKFISNYVEFYALGINNKDILDAVRLAFTQNIAYIELKTV